MTRRATYTVFATIVRAELVAVAVPPLLQTNCAAAAAFESIST
jgi:hypothetical protein